MKATIMEYGLLFATVILGITFLASFGLLLEDSGDLNKIITDYISEIC